MVSRYRKERKRSVRFRYSDQKLNYNYYEKLQTRLRQAAHSIHRQSIFIFLQKENYLPSVTTILEAYPKDASYFKWLKDVGSDADAIRDEAGRRGSVVHELTERYDCNEEITLINDYGTPQYKMLEWSMFERYVEFFNNVQAYH